MIYEKLLTYCDICSVVVYLITLASSVIFVAVHANSVRDEAMSVFGAVFPQKNY